MAKKTQDEPVEPIVPSNRNKVRTVGLIAGGVLALGATFAAGAAVGHGIDRPRGGDFAAGSQMGEREHGPRLGGHVDDRDGMHGPRLGQRGGDRDGMHGPRGSIPDGSAPAPDVTP
ncbi:MAG: hypothetical protein NWS64_03720 [Microbacteriaceae bacterium]|nr:hypothetical protein [Microbacteriaceae bacterium]